MTFNARASVQQGLDHLAARLDPLIGQRLANALSGLSWTVILQELDSAKGYIGKEYDRRDLQAQLRILTERLGELRYPFDDPQTRLVSTLGGELRIVRNRWAHNSELTALDAWRTHDFAVRLLDHFGDTEGGLVAEQLRLEVLGVVARESGVIPEPAPAEPASVKPTFIERPESEDDNARDGEDLPDIEEYEADEDEQVTPDPSVLVRRNGNQTPRIGAERAEFEAWKPVIVGDSTVLGDLPKKAAKEQVRAVALEIAEFEGPIHIDRLATLTAASFGAIKLRAKRRAQISRQIQATGLLIDNDKFVWPETINRDTWSEFRPNTSDARRPFLQISPVEIANAAQFLRESGEAGAHEDLEVKTLQTFGRRRRTKQLVKHLTRALDS